MKIALVGDSRRKEKDFPLIREAKKVFDSCLYAPIDQIRVDIEREFTVKFYDKNLADFDYVLPIPTLRYVELFYTVMKALSEFVYLPFTPEKYLLASNKPLLFHYLRENRVKTRDFLLLTSKTPIKDVKGDIAFPSIIKQPYKEVVVTNFRTFHDVISLTKAGSPILVWNEVKFDKEIWIFLTDNFITSYEKTKNSSKPIEVGDELRGVAVKIKKLIGCDYCALNFFEYRNEFVFNQFTFSPDFSSLEKITKENIAKILIGELFRKAKRKGKWWQKIFEVVRR